MLRTKQAELKDQLRWDEYVLSNTESSPYHLWAWRKSIEQTYGHKAFYYYIEDEEEIVGILPLINLRFHSLLNELTGLPFCDVGNIIANSKNVQDRLLEKVIEAIKNTEARKCSFRGELSYSIPPESKLFAEATRKVRMLLPLPISSEILLKGFKSKLRSQIRKALKNGVRFEWAGPEGVDDFYAVYCRNMRDLGSPAHSKQWFSSVMTNYEKRARIGLARYKGQCIGAGLILSTGYLTAIPWASTLRGYNRLSPNMLLYWNFLEFSSDNGCRCFDFGRSTEGEGTYKFKKQWGALPVPLQWYSLHENNAKAIELQRNGINARDLIAATWKKMPLPLANFIGPHLRKYISL